MANDYISRDYAVEKMENFPWDTEHDKNAAIHLVRELVPAADVRPVVHGEPIYRKPKTHRDELHTMTNEELAALLANEACPTKESIRCKEFFNYCDSCWLDWLKQEVNNG